VNVETLRYYERRGLLPEPKRAPSGRRRYDEETVRFLRAIKEAQAVGFTLAEIAEYVGAARRSGSPSEALRVRMAAKIDEIDSRIAGLRRMREELARVVGCACDSLDHCTCGAAYLARRGREPEAPPATLHVTNGESAGNTLRQTAVGERSCRGRTCSTRARSRGARVRRCSVPGPTSWPGAGGGAGERSSRGSSGATASTSMCFVAARRSCSGSSTTSSTSSSSWTPSQSHTKRGAGRS
jgi:DNA-binding transcriptional MerR regulator